jgi:hypothetical protein
LYTVEAFFDTVVCLLQVVFGLFFCLLEFSLDIFVGHELYLYVLGLSIGLIGWKFGVIGDFFWFIGENLNLSATFFGLSARI